MLKDSGRPSRVHQPDNAVSDCDVPWDIDPHQRAKSLKIACRRLPALPRGRAGGPACAIVCKFVGLREVFRVVASSRPVSGANRRPFCYTAYPGRRVLLSRRKTTGPSAQPPPIVASHRGPVLHGIQLRLPLSAILPGVAAARMEAAAAWRIDGGGYVAGQHDVVPFGRRVGLGDPGDQCLRPACRDGAARRRSPCVGRFDDFA